jgi:EAL domain-containing protein (putative c-di-GMP-specific phosphodiesterase class I)/PAS domain-containing protein
MPTSFATDRIGSAPRCSATVARRERDRFVALAFCWGELLVELDPDGAIAFAAGASGPLIGRPPTELLGCDFVDLIAPADRPLAESLLAFAKRRGRIDGAILRFITAGGETPVSIAGYRLEDLDGHYFLAFRQAPKPLRETVTRDPGTGLLTADSFIDLLTADHANAGVPTGSRMTFIDAEGYAEVCDRLTAGGERTLQAQVGALIKASALGTDAAATLAPGRFGLVHDAALDVGRLEADIGSLLRAADPEQSGAPVRTASLDLDDDGLRNADVAKGLVYAINRFKTAQGDALSVAGLSSSLSTLASQAVAAVRAFKVTVAEARFQVAFQPIVDARTGRIHHYEALARFPEDTGSVGPFQQILFAEETGLIVEFDLVMVAKVIDWLSKTPLNGSLQVAVNLSGLSVGAEGFLARLDRLLADNPWTRGRLMFEITESARMERLGAANRFIQRLREQGYPVCLDDFGAGVANFQYLAQLEVDVVKLDGEAVRNARKGAKGRSFLRALVNLCRDLGVRTIAEMIEDEGDMQFVRACGIDYVQGYLFGQAAADISAFANAIPRYLFDGSTPQ